MNRIILIGNGFDLAHGLKTSYKDFISWFWKNQKEKLPQDIKYWTQKYDTDKGKSYLLHENDFIAVTSYDFNIKFDKISLESFKSMISYTNQFLKNIDNNMKIKNWVDLEELYFEQLISCKNNYNNNMENYNLYPVTQLNKEFSSIRDKLEEYLKTQNEIITDNFQKDLVEKINKEIIHAKDCNGKAFNGRILFLNFNYTKTETLYTTKIKNADKKDVIHINGELEKRDENPIIFGYGDEKSKQSEEIENLNNNDFLENVKSVKYTETIKHGELEEFIGKGQIENKKYEVFVLGHSCGNSDRTLLRKLFEHENCEKIICYAWKRNDGTDDFLEKSRNIYRNFDDKYKYRQRLEEKKDKNNFKFLPQYNDKTYPFEKYNMVKVGKKEIEYTLCELPDKKETIKPFYISKYPVTQKQWYEIMKDEEKDIANPSEFKGFEDNPVENVSWDMIKIFIDKLNKIIEDSGCIFRLPSECEWEYAATSAGNYKANDKGYELVSDENDKEKQYLFARNSKTNIIEDMGWYWENSGGSTRPVGKKQSNDLGLFDMSGNVWEWCEDWYDNDNTYRVVRGGSWDNNAEYCRVSHRYNYHPDGRYYFIGFRLACSL